MNYTQLLNLSTNRKEFMKRYKIYRLKLDNATYNKQTGVKDVNKYIIY